VKGRTAYSFINCPDELQQQVNTTFGQFTGLIEGKPWFNGDHMIFAQRGVPTMALTAEKMSELMMYVSHTSRDTADLIDCRKLVNLAQALESFVHQLKP
jgi:aminopeptidase YwaD